jgi:hypothetical protein
MALVFMPFWALLPFIVNPERAQLLLSGTLSTWRLMTWVAIVIVASFATSVSLDWENRRGRKKAHSRD